MGAHAPIPANMGLTVQISSTLGYQITLLTHVSQPTGVAKLFGEWVTVLPTLTGGVNSSDLQVAAHIFTNALDDVPAQCTSYSSSGDCTKGAWLEHNGILTCAENDQHSELVPEDT